MNGTRLECTLRLQAHQRTGKSPPVLQPPLCLACYSVSTTALPLAHSPAALFPDRATRKIRTSAMHTATLNKRMGRMAR